MKVYNYVIMGVTLLILFTMFGIETGSSNFLSLFGLDNFQNIESGDLWSKMSLIFGVGVGGSLIVGSFSRTSPTYAIKAGLIMGVLVTLVWDFIGVLNVINDTGQTWLFWGLFTIFGAIIGGYAIALIEFWEGRD
ncbi:MAG: hypothetical protein ACLFUH_10575 [Bacteroidales bacterium]